MTSTELSITMVGPAGREAVVGFFKGQAGISMHVTYVITRATSRSVSVLLLLARPCAAVALCACCGYILVPETAGGSPARKLMVCQG
jgi:hypothetical protein